MAYRRNNLTAALLLIALVLSPAVVPTAQAAPSLASIAKARGVALPVLQALGALMGLKDTALANYLSVLSTQISQPNLGSLWISSTSGTWGTWKGQVMSAYYHPKRPHTVTTVGKLGTKRSVAAGGTWAFSQQTRKLWGNKAYYNTL